MTPLLVILTAVAALQQPQRSAARPTPSQEPVRSAGQQVPQRNPAFDTTAKAILDIGKAVADVRSEVDRLRGAAYNDPGGTLLEYAAAVRTKCQALAAAAQKGARAMCSHCVGGGVQPAVDQYRAYLPAVAQLGSRCAADVQRLRGRGDEAGATAVRRGARTFSETIVSGMRGYEAHLAPLLSALSGRPMGPARRPGG